MKKSNSKESKTNLECGKVKCRANRSKKNWAKLTKYASCTSSRKYFLSLLRSYGSGWGK